MPCRVGNYRCGFSYQGDHGRRQACYDAGLYTCPIFKDCGDFLHSYTSCVTFIFTFYPGNVVILYSFYSLPCPFLSDLSYAVDRFA